MGRYVLSPEIFPILETQEPGKDGEIQLTDAIVRLNQMEQVLAYNFTGKRYDVGDKLGFVQATIDFALNREDLHDDIKKYKEEKLLSYEDTEESATVDIAVLGTGYVGLVTGVCLAVLGHHVTCIDIDSDKIATLKKGTSPISEEGLTELLQKNLHNGNVRFTTDYAEGLSGKKLIYIAVGTPRSDDGSADLTYIDEAITSIAKHVVDDVIIVTKSTVPAGANEYIQEKIQ